jgi:leader peptidase (prepilin peptidase) / N-methyltransferase
MLEVFVCFAGSLVVAGALTLIADRAWLDTTHAHENRLASPLRLFVSLVLSSVCAFAYWQHGFEAPFWKISMFATTLLLVAYVNQRTSRVPNILTFALLALGLLQSTVTAPGLASSLVGAVVGGGLLFIPFALGGIGGGALKLQAALGAWLGWELALLAFIPVVGVSVAHAIWKARREPTGKLPLATYIALSGVLASLWAK